MAKIKICYEKITITQEVVMKMLDAACCKAQELGIRVNIAIVDDGGNLKGFLRMDEAPLLSSEISQNKAYTSAAFGIPTANWYPMIKEEPELLHGIVHTSKLVIFGGGLPILIHGKLAGGIGVSGGSAEEDTLCAEAALTFLDSCLNLV